MTEGRCCMLDFRPRFQGPGKLFLEVKWKWDCARVGTLRHLQGSPMARVRNFVSAACWTYDQDFGGLGSYSWGSNGGGTNQEWARHATCKGRPWPV